MIMAENLNYNLGSFFISQKKITKQYQEKMMTNKANTIEPLKKVSLEYTAGTTPESNDLIPAPKSMAFIFGIGTEGLTAFECALDGKSIGYNGSIEVSATGFEEIFGHILSGSEMFTLNPGRFYFHYTIIGISDSAPREVVRSIAAAAGSGCGGNCGCGCGS